MSGIDAFLFRRLFREVPDQLMARQTQRDGVCRFAPERTAKAIYIEPLGLSRSWTGKAR